MSRVDDQAKTAKDAKTRMNEKDRRMKKKTKKTNEMKKKTKLKKCLMTWIHNTMLNQKKQRGCRDDTIM